MDTGSNVHISNSMDTMFCKKDVNNVTLGQASGSKAKVKYVGSLACVIGNSFLKTQPKYTLGMPDNPSSTISTYCLKNFAGYIRASHESNDFFRTIDTDGNEFWFTKQNGLLKTINGLDYIPIIHPVESAPIAYQAKFRKSSRVPKPTVKMKEYLKTKNQQSQSEASPTKHVQTKKTKPQCDTVPVSPVESTLESENDVQR